MRKQYKKKSRTKKFSSPVQRLTVVRKLSLFSGIGWSALGTSGEDADTVSAPYATTPRALRPIPENRDSVRTTVSVASLERDFGHFSAGRLLRKPIA